MGVWLSIVSGTVKLLNYLAAALQQHHDEMNGRRAQAIDDLQASARADTNATIIRENNDALGREQLLDKLRDQTGVTP